MGQKVHPIGFRLGYTKTWSSIWFRQKGYAQWLHEDLKLKKFIKTKLMKASVADIIIERQGNQLKIQVFTAKPGLVIGKKGKEAEKLKQELTKLAGLAVNLKIQEIRKPNASAQLVAETVSNKLLRRISFRRAMKAAVRDSLNEKDGKVKGIKIRCAGRLGGAEMARCEWYREGRVPLQTLRANIDYGFATARTTYGAVGVKVWIYKGDILK